jgi:pSer/pThr/pTyr-binding forkhead associated (FHA) protein
VVVAVDPSLELATREFALAPESIIGRDATATVFLPDSFISNRHARLSFRRGRWWIEDLGSTNGTGLSGNAVVKPTAVRPDDVIEVGRVRLQIRPS